MNVTKMNSIPWNAPELRGSLAGVRYPAFAEIKLDGEFNFIEYNNGKIATINKYGTVKQDFHDLQRMLYVLNGNNVNQAILLCELYWGDGKLGDLYDLLRHKTDDNVHIHVFDVMQKDGVDLKHLPLLTRKEILWEMVGQWQIGDRVVSSRKEAYKAFGNAVKAGYEGVVIKSLDSPLILGPCSWAKMKYKDQNECEVANVDPDKERIEIYHNSPVGHVLVGVKAPNRYKKYINVHDTVTIEHQGVLSTGSLRHPVLIPKKEWK